MKNRVLDSWQFNCKEKRGVIVIPDGCRDLIVKQTPGKKPIWFLSDLYDNPGLATLLPGERMVGFRFRAGTEFDSDRLLTAARDQDPNSSRVAQAILDHTKLSNSVEEALACISEHRRSLKQQARSLGVSPRTLQRLLISKTGRPPRFWMSIVRVRNAGRTLTTSSNLADHAAAHGYSDQSHMTREFKRWFCVTPSKLLASNLVSNLLAQPGYD